MKSYCVSCGLPSDYGSKNCSSCGELFYKAPPISSASLSNKNPKSSFAGSPQIKLEDNKFYEAYDLEFLKEEFDFSSFAAMAEDLEKEIIRIDKK